MCGIVGAISKRDIVPTLLMGLQRLEYRGYDSAGIAGLDNAGDLFRLRVAGKVSALVEALKAKPTQAHIGIAHTRWATHGKPTEHNAHPHQSGQDIVLVHNGIIENHEALRAQLSAEGYRFETETDTEVVAHLLHDALKTKTSLLEAVQHVVPELQGSFALVILNVNEPDKLIGVCQGNPLVIGLGFGENFFASDSLALLPVTQSFIYLHVGDVAEIKISEYTIYDAKGKVQHRPIRQIDKTQDGVDKGHYRHYMQKEIFEQALAMQSTLEGRLASRSILPAILGPDAEKLLPNVERVQIIACGTSYHAGWVAKYWIESIAKVPCAIDIASEYRYRDKVIEPNTLLIAISQSGETADTLSAFRQAKPNCLATMAICNVPESALVREANLVFMTRAGTEIGVASTKAFTTQLAALFMFTLALASVKKQAISKDLLKSLEQLPRLIEETLTLEPDIAKVAQRFVGLEHALFLGRGLELPIAFEGALKLKEISYIHAEAYAAGELKHGPLALVDPEMVIVVLAPYDELIEKLKSNIQEVKARGGQLIVISDEEAHITPETGLTVLNMPSVNPVLAPMLYVIPLQLLAYHVAVLKGTDVDQPRNLAKSVTVE